MLEYFEVLKKSVLFHNFSDDEIEKVLNCIDAKISKYKKNEYILNMNDKPIEFGILLDGNANIQKLDLEGKLNIVSNISKSELFAEAFVYAEINNSLVNVCCVENSVALLINKDNIINLLLSDVNLYKKLNDNILRCMSKKLVGLNRKIDILTAQNIRERILIYLNSLSENGKKSIVETPFNREQLADFLGVNRSSLSRELSKMKELEIIDFYKNTFKLL